MTGRRALLVLALTGAVVGAAAALLVALVADTQRDLEWP